jgi:sugar phosphate isomerase/epimerase
LRNQIKENGAVALDFAKEQGFVEVEIGLESHFGLTAEQMKEALQQRGLKPIAAHAGQGFLLNQTEKAVEAANFFGIKYVGVAWASHKAPLDEAQTLKIAEDFNTIGKRLHEKGIQFFYHNHGYEFQPYKDGETLFDLLVQKTDPELVKFEMDVLWTIFPGQDPAKLLKKYPNRWILMHLKDLAKGVEGNLSGGTDTKNDVALGSGQVDYPAVLKAAQEIGIKHYFIEDESADVLKQIPQSLRFLSGIRIE